MTPHYLNRAQRRAMLFGTRKRGLGYTRSANSKRVQARDKRAAARATWNTDHPNRKSKHNAGPSTTEATGSTVD